MLLLTDTQLPCLYHLAMTNDWAEFSGRISRPPAHDRTSELAYKREPGRQSVECVFDVYECSASILKT